jgi:adenosylcobyric acid synthase
VFASVIGTVQLLTPDERALFRGFAINKFRGELSLFDEGVRLLEARTNARCLGVFPYADAVQLDPEDSLALNTAPRTPAPPGARIAIVRFPQLSNATDFSLLTWAEWITVPPREAFDFIILPGSKNTLSDLAWLRSAGLAEWILDQHRRGAFVIGVCGGYQMLGRSIADPDEMESSAGQADGLGLIPAVTELARDKTTRAVTATTPGGVRFGAYEIHLGVTTVAQGSMLAPFARLDEGTVDGVRGAGVLGTYLHGALETPRVCAEIFGMAEPSAISKANQYRRMAEWFAAHAPYALQTICDPTH